MIRRVLLSVALASLAHAAGAATASYTATVQRILVDASSFGGCAAKTTPGPETVAGVSCGSGWVTMDCASLLETTSKTSANLLAAAQLAYVTGSPARIVVDDSKKANGKCLARQIQNRESS